MCQGRIQDFHIEGAQKIMARILDGWLFSNQLII